MPHLHSSDTSQQNRQNRSGVPLTPETMPAIARVLLKTGHYADFAGLVADAAKNPVLMQTLKPFQIRKAAGHLAEQGAWGKFVQLVCAVEKETTLLVAIKPAMITQAAKYLLAPGETGNAKAYNLSGFRDFAEMVSAISSQKKLMAAIEPGMVEKVAAKLADSASHSYFYGGKDQTVFYPEYASGFTLLAKAVGKDPRLNIAIGPVQVGQVIRVFFETGQQKVNEHQTDQGYPTEIRKGFTGFEPFGAAVKALDDAPDTWKAGVSDAVADIFKAGTDYRSVPYLARVVQKSSWVMDKARFNDVVHTLAEKGINTSHMTSFLHHLSGVDHLQTEYPGAIRTLMRQMLEESDEFRITDDSIPGFDAEIAKAARESIADFAAGKKYAALSSVLHRGKEEGITREMQKELADHDLYSFWVSTHDREDPRIYELMPKRYNIDLVFRKAAGDAVVCLDSPVEISDLIFGSRPARDVIGPVTTRMEIEQQAPMDLNKKSSFNGGEANLGIYQSAAPGILHAFARVVARPDGVPDWVRQIAKNIMASPPAP